MYICLSNKAKQKPNNMTKNIIQRNLPLSETYFFVSAKYISVIDGGGCACDNCGKLIANIITIKNKSGIMFNVGSDCAETLQSLKSDVNYFMNKDVFTEGKHIRSKIQKYIKKQTGASGDVINFRLWESLKTNETYVIFETRDGGSSMQKLNNPIVTKSYIKDLLNS